MQTALEMSSHELRLHLQDGLLVDDKYILLTDLFALMAVFILLGLEERLTSLAQVSLWFG